ncbi:MAG: SulP family inorganic anion transporter, partial [Cryomorphaceae bacterium]
SGAPLFSGIISGIIGGIIVGLLSQSSTSVSGPAAGLVVIVLNALDTLGTLEGFMLAVVIAGILQLILGFAKAGVIGLYFPSAVIKGMLAAIGLILILKQIPHLIGFDEDAFGEMEFLQRDGRNTFTGILDAIDNMQVGSAIIGFVSLALMFLWATPIFKKIPVLKDIPGGVMVVVIGVFVNIFFESFVPQLAIDGTHMVSLPIINDFGELKREMIHPDWSMLTNIDIYIVAVTLTIVASLETLLSLEAADRLDPENRHSPQNAELKAQGVGNILSGLIGGLPITAVIVRSSTNIEAGAKTKLSAILHGILLLVAVALIPGIMQMIPLASLAAILIYVGFKLTKPSIYMAYFKMGNKQFIPFIVTVVSIMFTDLLIGILIGMSIGIFYIIRSNYRSPYLYEDEAGSDGKPDQIRIRLSEHVSFLNKADLRTTLDRLPINSIVVLDGSRTKQFDHDALEVIHDFLASAPKREITVESIDIPDFK